MNPRVRVNLHSYIVLGFNAISMRLINVMFVGHLLNY